jgi:hypothetical protein
LLVLLVNDQWLKARYGNALTGKLSDVAGLIVVPVVVASIIELIPGRPLTSTRLMAALAIVTAALFTLVQLWWPAGELYEVAFGLFRWPIGNAGAIFTAESVQGPSPVALWRDATDLVALPACAVPVWLATRRAATSRQPELIGS